MQERKQSISCLEEQGKALRDIADRPKHGRGGDATGVAAQADGRGVDPQRCPSRIRPVVQHLVKKKPAGQGVRGRGRG